MNSQQRRKEKRKIIKLALFSVGDEVRYHHKFADKMKTAYENYFNTHTVFIVNHIYLNSSGNGIMYTLRYENEYIEEREDYLVSNTKEPRRSI